MSEQPQENSLMPRIFIPITKIDAERREVWGWGTIERPDHVDEVMDYASSKPLFLKWSEAAEKRSRGLSKGNVREMHKDSAAGVVISMQADDQSRGFYFGSRVVDDAAWEKVLKGVYTGYSIGGRYVRRWPDARPGLTRFTAQPTEISLVDAPCLEDAAFQLVKADGMTEMKFNAGTGAAPLQIEAGDEGGDPTLEKAMPGVPEPVVTIALGQAPEKPFNVEQLPNQSSVLPIVPGKEPSQEALQAAAADAKDLSAALDAWLPKLGKLMDERIAAALDSRGLLKADEPKMVKVVSVAGAPRMIKVVKGE